VINAAGYDMPMAVRTWAEQAIVSEGVIRGMIKAGQLIPVKVSGEESFLEPDQEMPRATLSDEQQIAADHIIVKQRLGTHQTILLEGVTGSGKTEVYFEAIAKALKR